MIDNNPKNFKKFKKTPLVLALASLLLFCGVFLFVYKEIKKNEAISEAMLSEWQTEATRREEIRSLERSIKKIAPETALIETHFANSSNIVPFLDTLESLAKKSGNTAEVKSVDIPAGKSELVVALKANGTFESLYKFIRLLENSPYELEITSFNIEKLGKTSQEAETSTPFRWEGSFIIKLLSFTK